MSEATLVKVHPGPNQGKAEICKLEHITVTPHHSVYAEKQKSVSQRSQTSDILHLPKEAIYLRSRNQKIRSCRLPHRQPTPALPLPTLPWNNQQSRLRPRRKRLWFQPLRYPRSHLRRTLQRTCCCPLLRFPDLLCGAMVFR